MKAEINHFLNAAVVLQWVVGNRAHPRPLHSAEKQRERAKPLFEAGAALRYMKDFLTADRTPGEGEIRKVL